MPRQDITLADLDYAATQLDDQGSLMLFGSRPWEMYISANHPELWMMLVGDCGTGDQNREMRRLMTIVYAPIFRMHDGTLPMLPPEKITSLEIIYPADRPLEEMYSRMQELMAQRGPFWGKVVLTHFRESPLTPTHLYRTGLYSLLLLESLQPCDFILDPVPPELPPDPPKEAPAQEKHATPMIMPITDNPVRFSDIGGYDDIKTTLRDVAQMFNQPSALQRWGVQVPRGVLLNGPSGVGKTYFAHALANEIKKPFFDVKRTQITSIYINESSKWIDEMFTQLKKSGGGVLFLDEVDGLIFSRGSSHMHAEDHKIVTILNQNLQRPATPDGILVIMATNRKDLLDSATIRAERIDLVIDFRNPNFEDRRAVFSTHAAKAEAKAGRPLFQRDLDKRIITDTEGYSCADIAEMIQRVLRQRAKGELAGVPDSLIGSDEMLSTIATYHTERFSTKKRSIGFARS